MKSMTIPGGTSNLAISGAIACLLMLTGCGNRAGVQVESKAAGASAATRNEGSGIPANSASPTTSGAPTTDKATPGSTGARNKNNPRVAGAPSPQINTGGSDFFLFTQARAALGADHELKAANIVIDVKAGLLTLGGTVANAEQKSKAEQLVRAVEGVKAVKNRLRISIANAEAAPRGARTN